MQFKQLRNETSLLHHNLLFCGIHSVIKGRNAVTLVFQFETGEAYMSIMVQLSKTSPPGPRTPGLGVRPDLTHMRVRD